MTTLKNGFEFGTNGTVLVSANSGDATNNVFSAVSTSVITLDASHVAHGSKAAKFQVPSGSPTDSAVLRWTQAQSTAMAARMYVYMTSLVTADHHLLHFRTANNATRVASVHLNGASKLRLSDATGTAGVWTATNVMPINQWVRIELYAKPGTTTNNGELRLGVYMADSVTAIETAYISTISNLGTAGIDTIVFGKNSNSAYSDAFWLDDLYASDTIAGLPGPYMTTPSSSSSPLYRWDGTTWQRVTLHVRDAAGWKQVS